MKDKRKIWLALLFCIFLAAYIFLGEVFSGTRNVIVCGLFGAAFLILFACKKKVWALVLGLGFLFIFVMGQLNGFHSDGFIRLCIGAVLAAFGCFLLERVKIKEEYGYLLSGCAVFWTGIFICLLEFSVFRQCAAPLLATGVGVVFYHAYLLAGRQSGIWSICLSIFLFFVSLFFMLGNPVISIAAKCILIGLDGVLCVVAMRELWRELKRRKDRY